MAMQRSAIMVCRVPGNPGYMMHPARIKSTLSGVDECASRHLSLIIGSQYYHVP